MRDLWFGCIIVAEEEDAIDLAKVLQQYRSDRTPITSGNGH
jgi:hypothetical protein